MTLFRLFLVVVLVAVAGYTAVVVTHHGLGFLPVFFADIARMNWAGQFNLDFMGMLALSALWVAWRHGFGPQGLLLGLVAIFGGTPFLCTYLLVQSFRCRGDLRLMLLGQRLADR